MGGRPEVVLEGSMSPAGPWLEYQFPHKPGDVARPPKFWCVQHHITVDTIQCMTVHIVTQRGVDRSRHSTAVLCSAVSSPARLRTRANFNFLHQVDLDNIY